MTITTNLNGTTRKTLATLIAEQLGCTAKYCGAPSFAYEAGPATIDKDGTVNPNAAVDVVFPGNVIGTCSADMKDLVPMPSRCRRTWHGRALGVVRKK